MGKNIDVKGNHLFRSEFENLTTGREDYKRQKEEKKKNARRKIKKIAK